MEPTRSVLLCDEDAATRAFLADNLAADGYHVLVAASKAGALARLESSQPDLVICDVNGDTLELLDAVPQADGVASHIDPHVSLIVLTARADELARVRLYGRGGDDVIAKPFSYPELRARVRALLRRSCGRRREPVIEVGARSTRRNTRMPARWRRPKILYQQGPCRPRSGMSTSDAAVMSPLSPRAVLAALGTLAVAVITLVTVFDVVDWTAAQTALVTAEVAAVAGLATALVAHLKPDTAKEHVALAATFTATVAATLALGSGFDWWNLTEQETSAIAGVVTAVLGVGGAVIAREHVTPVRTAK